MRALEQDAMKISNVGNHNATSMPHGSRLEFEVPNIDAIPLLANVWMPFETGLNSAIDYAEEQNFDWLENLGLAQPGDNTWRGVQDAAFHHLTSLVYREEDELGLALATNFVNFLFIFDDMVDSHDSEIGMRSDCTRQAAEMMMRGVHGHVAARGDANYIHVSARLQRKLEGLQNALADISARMLKFTVDGRVPNLQWYAAAVREYLEGNVREAINRETTPSLDVRSYSDLRIDVSGVYPCLEVGCITRRVELPDNLRSRWDFGLMQRACNLHVSYVNDLFSYKKEALACENSNLVIILERSGRYGAAQAAMNKACQICDISIIEYFDAARKYAAEGRNSPMRRTMRLMESWMRGNLDWYLAQHERYCAASSTDLSIGETTKSLSEPVAFAE
jgi:hypothetical protein